MILITSCVVSEGARAVSVIGVTLRMVVILHVATLSVFDVLSRVRLMGRMTLILEFDVHAYVMLLPVHFLT
jgi:hypothetical protein